MQATVFHIGLAFRCQKLHSGQPQSRELGKRSGLAGHRTQLLDRRGEDWLAVPQFHDMKGRRLGVGDRPGTERR